MCAFKSARNTEESLFTIFNDYGNVFAEGTSYLAGHLLEKYSETETKQTFQLTSKTAYFHRESILYPYVQFTESLPGDITVYRTKQFFTPLTFYDKLLLLIQYVG